MRILIRGSSIAAGYGVTKAYPEILAEKLCPSNIEIINRSYYRETSFNGVWSFDEDILPYKPDILILNFGIDDVFYPVYRSEFQENHVQMIRRARRFFKPKLMIATSQTFDDPYEMDAVNIYYRSLKIVANDLDCELIPVHLFWAGYLHENNLKCSDLTLTDARYPNESGHKIFAEAISGHIKHG
jgi:lysophospholipase L1-like esterase